MQWVSAVVVLLAVAGAAAVGGDFYVSPDGDDSGPGTPGEPWGSIQRAIDAAGPGDTVHVAPGTYRERVKVRNSGTPGAPVRLVAGDGGEVLVDGEDLGGWGVFTLRGVHHVEIHGLTVANARDRGGCGFILYEAGDITIRNCHTRNTGSSGVKIIRSERVRVEGNQIEQACLDGGEECITVKLHSSRVQVLGNHIHHCRKEGIDVKEGAHHVRVRGNLIHNVERQGLYTDAWDQPTKHVEFSRNVIHHCGFGIAACAEQGGLLEDVRVVNNLVYECDGPGLVVADWGGGDSHPIDGVVFVNNTVYATAKRWGAGMWFENAEARGIVVRNNIFSRNGLGQMIARKEPQSATIDHNLIDGETELAGSSHVAESPLFADPEAGDFHLREGSPAIDAGSREGAPQEDFDGEKRPHGAGPDIGADEHHPPSAEAEDAD